MYETIRNFARQFTYKPHIENVAKLTPFDRFVVVGMGGSGLAAGLLKTCNPGLNLTVHQDYGLPPLPEEDLAKSLIIASSYSGNTEEVLDAYELARSKNYSVATISTGGTLMERAKRDSVPYIQLPDTGIQPRSARGYSFMAILKMMREEIALTEASTLAESLKAERYEENGKALSSRIAGKIPVIYASTRNAALAYNWKITFNETGKIPSFLNIFPELNHNEMAGYTSKDLNERFYFVFLKDPDDHARIKRRMDVLADLYRQRGMEVEVIEMEGPSIFHKLFATLLVADWAAYYTAKASGADSKKISIVEEFKKLI